METFWNGLTSVNLENGFKLEVCTGMGTAGIPQNPREIRGNGYRYRGNTAGWN